MTELQKKQLEKVYTKMFEGSDGSLTEEGRNVCMQLDINPQDLVIMHFDDFKHSEAEPEEVVQIRYDHYKNRRFRK